MAALSYKYRIEPNRAQATAFGDMLADFCQLYHAGLEQRIAAYARCKRTSKARSKRKAALAKFQGRVAAKRRDHLHKVARKLVTRFGRIGIEDLNIKGLAGGMLKVVHFRAFGFWPGAGRGSPSERVAA